MDLAQIHLNVKHLYILSFLVAGSPELCACELPRRTHPGQRISRLFLPSSCSSPSCLLFFLLLVWFKFLDFAASPKAILTHYTPRACLDGFSSAGSELWTVRRRTFCWEPRGDFKARSFSSLVFLLIRTSTHIDTHKAFLHRHFSKKTTSRTLDKMKVLLLDWVAQQRLHVVWKKESR